MFMASHFGGSARAGWQLGRRESVRARLLARYRFRRYLFRDGRQTHKGFKLPDDFNGHHLQLEFTLENTRSYRRFKILQGASLRVTGGYAYRDRWRQWGDTPDTRTGDLREFQEFTWIEGRLGFYERFFDDHNLRVEVAAAIGNDLDRVSGFAIGSSYGQYRLLGYYFTEFVADRLVVLNAEYGADLPWGELRGYLYLDSAYTRILEDRRRWLTGFGVGLKIPVPVGGREKLPVLVRYAYGPNARRRSRRGGHELEIRVVFAF